MQRRFVLLDSIHEFLQQFIILSGIAIRQESQGFARVDSDGKAAKVAGAGGRASGTLHGMCGKFWAGANAGQCDVEESSGCRFAIGGKNRVGWPCHC